MLINIITKIYLDRHHAGPVRLMSLRYRRVSPGDRIPRAYRTRVHRSAVDVATATALPTVCPTNAAAAARPDPCTRRLPAQHSSKQLNSALFAFVDRGLASPGVPRALDSVVMSEKWFYNNFKWWANKKIYIYTSKSY